MQNLSDTQSSEGLWLAVFCAAFSKTEVDQLVSYELPQVLVTAALCRPAIYAILVDHGKLHVSMATMLARPI